MMGFFPANRVGDDIELYTDENRTHVLDVFHTLRQQAEKPENQPNFALADFIAPKETGHADYLGAFAVTAGLNIEPLVAKFEANHDDYNAIMTKALADRLAEALAELTAQEGSRRLGLWPEENLSVADLIKEKYQGIRPARRLSGLPRSHRKANLVRPACKPKRMRASS